MLTSRLDEAAAYARALHAPQVRKGTTVPYFSHLMAVSAAVLENGGSEDAAIAALLHDAVEDCGGTPVLEEIRARFGDHVAHIVEACSDSLVADAAHKLPWEERKRAYLASLAHKHPDALLVTLCDKLHNARAIRQDLRQHGDELWSRFGGKPAAQVVSYYSALVERFRAVCHTKLVDKFAETVAAIEAQVDQAELARFRARLLADA